MKIKRIVIILVVIILLAVSYYYKSSIGFNIERITGTQQGMINKIFIQSLMIGH